MRGFNHQTHDRKRHFHGSERETHSEKRGEAYEMPLLLLVTVLAAASTTALAQGSARSSEFQAFLTRTKTVKTPDQQASSVLSPCVDDPVALVALEDTSSRFGVCRNPLASLAVACDPPQAPSFSTPRRR
ncbi:hypothetical protein NL676_015709 [Syzygium grande]|nr:hypothetical protein NL676_015709 [Syzygium grande]